VGEIGGGELGTGDFAAAVVDHYLVNPVCRASELMAELSSRARARNQPPIAAE
jgi:NADH-quinone oxidoreductase subunit G